MTKQFIIVNTWNGEGYTYLNGAHVVSIPEDMNPNAILALEATQSMSEFFVDESVTDKEDGVHRFSTINDDSGSVQMFPIDLLSLSRPYGVVIEINHNEAEIVATKEAYESKIRDVFGKGNASNDFNSAEESAEADSAFIVGEDKDYQFIRIDAMKVILHGVDIQAVAAIMVEDGVEVEDLEDDNSVIEGFSDRLLETLEHTNYVETLVSKEIIRQARKSE